MKKGSTWFLRAVVIFLGLGVLALCIFALPSMWRGGSAEFPAASQSIYLIVIGLYATTVPFYIGLWHTFKLLSYIDHDKAFSDFSVKALRTIKYSAIAVSVLYVGGVPLLYPIAQADDAPGLYYFWNDYCWSSCDRICFCGGSSEIVRAGDIYKIRERTNCLNHYAHDH